MNTKIQTIVLYSTNKGEKTSSFLLNLKKNKKNRILLPFAVFSFNFDTTIYSAVKFSLYLLRNMNVIVNTTMQQKTYITLSENVSKTAKPSLDHS